MKDHEGVFSDRSRRLQTSHYNLELCAFTSGQPERRQELLFRRFELPMGQAHGRNFQTIASPVIDLPANLPTARRHIPGPGHLSQRNLRLNRRFHHHSLIELPTLGQSSWSRKSMEIEIPSSETTHARSTSTRQNSILSVWRRHWFQAFPFNHAVRPVMAEPALWIAGSYPSKNDRFLTYA